MTKVTRIVSETPTEQIIAQASEEITVTDPRGRAIKLGKPNVLSQLRLIDLVGAETAGNVPYMQIVSPLIFIKEIDGDRVFQPLNKLQLEAIVEKVGEDCLSFIMVEVGKKWGQKPGEEASKEAVKK